MRKQGKPSQATWLAAATAEAIALGLDPKLALTRRRSMFASLARWRAMNKLYATGRYSKNGMAITIGCDHTSVMYALRTLPDLERRCAGRTPKIHGEPKERAEPKPKPPTFKPIPVLVPADTLRRMYG